MPRSELPDKAVGGIRRNGVKTDPLRGIEIQQFFIDPFQRVGIAGGRRAVFGIVNLAGLDADQMTDRSIDHIIAVLIGCNRFSHGVTQFLRNLRE